MPATITQTGRPPVGDPRRQAPTWKRVLGGLYYGLICVAALAVGIGSRWLYDGPVLLQWAKQTLFNTQPADVFNSESVTLLILGCDEDRSPGGRKVLRQNARSDMMLVAKIDFANKRIGGVSIPRDLQVQLPGYRAQKINAYHSIGGKDLAKRAAEMVLGINIDRVIVLNYLAFQEMVNIVGGVDIYVPKNMRWTDRAGDLYINLKKGRQKLNGYQAMCFVRFRHSDSDFMRMERQRDFMLALKEAVASSPGLLSAVTNKAAEVLGGELSSDELAALGRFAQKVPSDSIKLASVPVREGSGTNLLLNDWELAKVLRENYIVSSNGASDRVTYR